MRLARVVVALLGLCLVAPALAEDVIFSGLVTYRERLVLPADATLTIALVTLPAGGPVTSASAPLNGRSSSPVQFSLSVRSTLIDSGAYGLKAEIIRQGHVIFRNIEPVAVDVDDPLGIIIEVLLGPPPPDDRPEQALEPVGLPNPLLDVVWTVIGIGGDPVLAGTTVTLSIAADQRAGGTAGCNSYFTEASFEPLSFGPIAGTRMACAPAVMEQEARFFAALNGTVGYQLAGAELALVDASGIPVALLARVQ